MNKIAKRPQKDVKSVTINVTKIFFIKTEFFTATNMSTYFDINFGIKKYD